jgi:hypothetical protein
VENLDALWVLQLYKVLDHCHVVWPTLLNLVVLFQLPNNDDLGEELVVVEVLLGKLDLSLVEHHQALLVVMGLFVLKNFVEGVTNHSYDEVHEDHEQEHNSDDPNRPCCPYLAVWVSIIFNFVSKFINFIAVEYIERLVWVNECEISHRASEDWNDMRHESRHPSISTHVNLQEVEALCES